MSFGLESNSSNIDFGEEPKRKRGLSIIPLIDIAFFLLIFFMVAGSLNQFDIIEITPPTADSGELMDEGHITILLGTHDEIVMDDELLSLDEMQASLKEQFALNPDKVITLKADESIPAIKMIAVMDVIKAAGGKQMTIATQENNGGK